MNLLWSRREFLRKAAQIAGSTAVVAQSAGGAPAASRLSLPRRKLGRTGAEVSVIGMGLAPLGIARYSFGEFESVVQTAIDEGVNYFDTQPDYGDTERYLAPVARRHREWLFVVTKTGAKSKEAVLDSIAASLSRLELDQVDAVLLNNVGDYDMRQLFAANGALAGLRVAKRRRHTRFIGISGHYRAEQMAAVLEKGVWDIVMAPLNFADRFTYAFEHEILPVAVRHGVGVVAMKTLGGAAGLKYDTREQTAMLPAEEHDLAIRFVLNLPGVCSAVVGCKSAAEIRAAARIARDPRLLDPVEQRTLMEKGKNLAAQWGRHYPEG